MIVMPQKDVDLSFKTVSEKLCYETQVPRGTLYWAKWPVDTQMCFLVITTAMGNKWSLTS